MAVVGRIYGRTYAEVLRQYMAGQAVGTLSVGLGDCG